MNTNSRSIIDEIVSRVEIVEVVSQYVKLTKKGKNHFGLCPFHNDTSPSMSVSPEKRMFKCFVCGAAGNAITFVSDIEKVSFSAAMQKLAERVGVDFKIQKVEAHYNEAQEKLVSVFKDAKEFYTYSLLSSNSPESSKALEYIKSRGLDNNVIKEFGIGYAPNEGLANLLLSKEHSEASLINSSLVNQISNNQFSDRNRNRVIFSIFNEFGDVVGFSARALDDSKPKYINTSENEIFKKTELLYNYNTAQQYIDKDNHVYVCEGFMDVIALYRIGVKNAVAIMGTSLTKDHAEKLKNRKVTLILDFDQAGIDATKRAIDILKEYTPLLNVIVSNQSKDPDEILSQEGPETLKKLLKQEVDFVKYMFQMIFKVGKPEEPNDQKNAIKEFFKYVGKNDNFAMEYWSAKISKELNMSFEAVSSVINNNKPLERTMIIEEKVDATQTIVLPDEDEFDQMTEQEHELLNAMLTKPDYILEELKEPKYRVFNSDFVNYVFASCIEIKNRGELNELFDGYNPQNDKRKLWKKIYNDLRDNKRIQNLPNEEEFFNKISNLENFVEVSKSQSELTKRMAIIKKKSILRKMDEVKEMKRKAKENNTESKGVNVRLSAADDLLEKLQIEILKLDAIISK